MEKRRESGERRSGKRERLERECLERATIVTGFDYLYPFYYFSF